MENHERIERIKYLIKELNLKQRDFAERIGVDTSNLSKYLNGKLPINDSFVNRLVVNLGVSKQWVMQGTDIPFPKNTYSDSCTLYARSATNSGSTVSP